MSVVAEASGPLWHEIKTNRFWFLLGVGVICLLGSISWEQSLELSRLQLSIDERLKEAGTAWYSRQATWAAFMREVGFAALIALVIGVLVERASRVKQAQTAHALLMTVSRNVFGAVLGSHVPASISQHVLGSIFSAPMIRHQLRLTFTVMNLPEGHGDRSSDCVLLRLSTSYELENVSGVTADHRIRLYYPIPSYPGLCELAKIESVSIDDQLLPTEELESGNDAVPNTDYERRSEWPVSVGKERRVRVTTSHILVKEFSDSEIWSSLLPTAPPVEVTVDMQVQGLVWNVDSHHSGKLRAIDDVPDGPRGLGQVTFRCNEALLPFQGVNLWWRPERPTSEASS